MALGRIGTEIGEALSGVIKGAGDVVGTTIEVTRKTIVDALRGVKDVGAEIGGTATDAVAGSVNAANQVGSGVGRAVKGTVVGIIRDLRLERRLEESIQAINERFDSLTSNAPIGIVITDAAGTILEVNPNAVALCCAPDERAMLGRAGAAHQGARR